MLTKTVLPMVPVDMLAGCPLPDDLDDASNSDDMFIAAFNLRQDYVLCSKKHQFLVKYIQGLH